MTDIPGSLRPVTAGAATDATVERVLALLMSIRATGRFFAAHSSSHN